MATDIVQSLFGVTPESYQEAQRQRAQAQAVQMAQLDPMQRAVADIRSGGYNLAQGLGGIMGAQDPMLQQISMQQDLLKTVNFNDPDSIAKAAQAATAFNPQLAAKLADMATGLMGKMVTQAKESAAATSSLASAKKAEFEVSDIGRGQALVEKGLYTPESVVQAIQSKDLSKLEKIDKLAKPATDFIAKAVELGFGDKATYGAYSPDQVKAINKAIFDEDIAKKAAGAQAIRVDLGSALEKIYLATDREESAKRWGEAGKAYEVTIPLLNQLDQVEKALPNAFTGAFAEPKLALSKALGGFGVNIGTRASDTEYINAISSKVVQQIARVFPGSLAVKELDQLVKSKFNVAQEAPTILRLLGQIRDEMKAQTITYEKGSKLPEKERTSFNTSLAIGQNMKQINRYRELENKYRSGTISDTERNEAKQLQQSLGL